MANKTYKINLHAGHNPDNKIGCGAIGLIKESTEAREIRKLVAQKLKKEGIIVYNTTCNTGTSQSNILSQIVKSCNSHVVDLDVSLHFNSGRSDKKGDGKTGGTEVWVKTNTGIRKIAATKICNQMEKIGFTNRGVKTTNELYFLNNTKAPAVLVEICFVDDADDVKLYKQNKDAIAKAITKGILSSFS